MEYKDFLRSAYWREVCRDTYQQRGRQCERCGIFGLIAPLVIHHRDYHQRNRHDAPDWVREGLAPEAEWLQVLCEVCHARHHGLPINYARAANTLRWQRLFGVE